ncbi:DUF3761 domain-containing protein [Terriglobus roseus]|uniref:DUF3761 domain-containing protein n=1 Tax=Terriglobus roseus TaxID=392734 RepID=UPI0009452A09
MKAFRFVSAVIFLPGLAFAQQTAQPKPALTSRPRITSSVGPISGQHYSNVDGNRVRTPMAAPSAPAGSTAKCGDGAYSFSQHRSGTCSHHGGVATWLVN